MLIRFVIARRHLVRERIRAPVLVGDRNDLHVYGACGAVRLHDVDREIADLFPGTVRRDLRETFARIRTGHFYPPAVITSDEHVTGSFDTIDVFPIIASVPLVPTVPSTTAVVPSLLSARKNDAVPVAAAVPCAIAFAVFTPEADAPNAVALKRSSARSVFP